MSTSSAWEESEVEKKAGLALFSRRGKDSAAANSGLIQICDEKHYREALKMLGCGIRMLAGESAAGIRLATSPSSKKDEGKFLLGLLPGSMVYPPTQTMVRPGYSVISPATARIVELVFGKT